MKNKHGSISIVIWFFLLVNIIVGLGFAVSALDKHLESDKYEQSVEFRKYLKSIDGKEFIIKIDGKEFKVTVKEGDVVE